MKFTEPIDDRIREEDRILKKYPKIFRQKDLSMKETCMCWGLDISKGWMWLIDGLCEQLQWYTDKNHYPQVEATQVKEKFGGLRFYYTFTNGDFPQEKYSFLEGMISLAEHLSEYICEDCGKTEGVFQTEGWITTICKECYKRRKNDKTNLNK